MNVVRGLTRWIISIHSLHTEGDSIALTSILPSQYFNPLPPYRGRRTVLNAMLRDMKFQSTPSIQRETKSTVADQAVDFVFQSTPSIQRETCRCRDPRRRRNDFNPLPPYRGRLRTSLVLPSGRFYFNPLPPYRGRLTTKSLLVQLMLFQSTPSIQRETQSNALHLLAQKYFNPLPPYRGRLS